MNCSFVQGGSNTLVKVSKEAGIDVTNYPGGCNGPNVIDEDNP